MMDLGNWAFNNKKLVYFIVAVLLVEVFSPPTT